MTSAITVINAAQMIADHQTASGYRAAVAGFVAELAETEAHPIALTLEFSFSVLTDAEVLRLAQIIRDA